jgi:hypothetical protein
MYNLINQKLEYCTATEGTLCVSIQTHSETITAMCAGSKTKELTAYEEKARWAMHAAVQKVNSSLAV